MLPIARISKAFGYRQRNKDQKANDGENARKHKRNNTRDEQVVLEQWKSLADTSSVEPDCYAKVDFGALKEAVPTNPGLAHIKLPGWSCKVSLKKLRCVIALANLTVLTASVLCLLAWQSVDAIKHEVTKGLSVNLKVSDPMHLPNPWIHDHVSHLLSHAVAHSDQVLFACGIILLSYWVVFGVYVALVYGSGPTDLLCTVLAYPCVFLISVGQVVLAILGMRVKHILLSLNCDNLRPQLSYMRVKMLVQMRDLLAKHGTVVAIFLCLSAAVQIVVGGLPYFMYDMPFQRKMDVEDLLLHDPSVKRQQQKNTQADANNNNVTCARKEYPQRAKFRSMSAAYTVTLKLSKPEVRDLHR